MKKTNAARILDKHKIPYELHEYKVDEDDLSAAHVAEILNIDAKNIFKTLLLLDENNIPLVACIPGDDELDLKKLAKSAKCKRCTMLPLKDLLKTTGYVRGGCSVIGMKKQFRTFMDKSAQEHEKIFLSAGVRGQQLHIDPKDLEKLFDITFADLISK
ncbi:MAG: Cys-tRNA(Pro) deacylase [Sulfurospirillaceae bacterium]|nr:Cys-tRNA(Pro) deacylase [Sulfurospirillaceae bacterium]